MIRMSSRSSSHLLLALLAISSIGHQLFAVGLQVSSLDDGAPASTTTAATTTPIDSIDDLSSSGEEARTAAGEFSLSVHPDDHGVYSGRSLWSTKNMRQPLVELDELEMEEEAKRGRSSEQDQSPLNTSGFVEAEWQLMFRAFDLAYDSASSSILEDIGRHTNLFEEIVGRLPAACQRDIRHIRDSAMRHKLWALRMLDSNGKIPSGVTYGRFSSPGDYEECLSTRVDELVYKQAPTASEPSSASPQARTVLARDGTRLLEQKHKFHGKYCLIDFRLPLPEKPRNKVLSIHDSVLNFTGTELERKYPEFVHNYSSFAAALYEVGYLHAFCLPSTCQVEDLTKSMGKSLEGMYLLVNSTVDCEEWPEQREPLRNSQLVALALMAIVFSNAALASLACYLKSQSVDKLDAYNISAAGQREATRGDRLEKRGKASSLRHKLVELARKNKFYYDCFSVQRNFERLSKPDPRGLTFVHYTRIVAMALTVITHTGALGTLQAITKPADASNSEQIFRDFLPQMLANAFTSIQIFFFMAGFMLVISTYPAIRRDKGRMSFLEYAIKRAIRLMPGLGATICLNFVWPLLVDGPMLKYFVRMIVIPCEDNWWHTLGFMSNFDHVEKMCLRHSYFSASDYQLHIVAFPLLILLYKQPVFSLFLAGLLTVAGFMAQVIMVLTKNVLPFMMVDYLDKEVFFNVIHYVHHPVWNHMSAFFYGFIIGYLVVRQIRVNLSEKSIKLIWYTLLPMGILSIFAPYFWNHYKRPIVRWQMVLYVIFDRFILLSTCAWLSYASMVLGRPPQPKSQSVVGHKKQASAIDQPPPPPPQLNTTQNVALPVIVQRPPSPSSNKIHQKSALFGTSFQKPTHSETTLQKPDTPTTERRSTDALKLGANLGLDQSGLPRQRSSPNLINELQASQTQLSQLPKQPSQLNEFTTTRRLSRTISSSNLATISEKVDSAQQQSYDDTSKSSSKPLGQFDLSPTQFSSSKPASGHEAQSVDKIQTAKKNAAPVSNINTLCLILSRLTFQLYLFNMVVLWVDVNHSKYYWFFSYYFIIVKAAAVYIASAIMAMIFFVVLESPCLTLYIAWVRSRAAAHPKSGHLNPNPVFVDSKEKDKAASK